MLTHGCVDGVKIILLLPTSGLSGKNGNRRKTQLQAELLEGSYRVSLLSRVTPKNQQEIDL